MALYAIGDLHLHFRAPLRARDQLRDPVWKNHERKLRRNCEEMILPEDTLVLVGDHSWGRNLSECEEDLQYVENLPGRKILLRGNHDMFWEVNKTQRLNDIYAGRLSFLQNNYYSYDDCALVGTKGHCFEGPFFLDRRGRIVGWDEKNEERSKKLVAREAERLRLSFEAAKKDGYHRFIVFLHYPPTDILEDESVFTRTAEEYGAEQLIYAHSHGERRFHDSIHGEKNGVFYRLTSGDYLNWRPVRIL